MPRIAPLPLLREIFGQAAATCLAHPLRSSLGALAIGVAVATLVLVETALDGVAAFARRTAARSFGADAFVVAQVASPGQVSREALRAMLLRNPPIRRTELRFLEASADGLALYAASAQRAADVVSQGRKFEGAAVTGTNAALAEIRELGLSGGRFFTREEERRAQGVAVIGFDVARELFPSGDPLGRELRLAGRAFRVVGVQGQLGAAAGASLDRYVWIPLPAFERAFGAPATLQITAQAPSGGPPQRAEDRARASMRARRQLGPGERDDFEILTPDAARSFVFVLVQRISAAAPPILAAALLAAIVVVTNTTLVSVSQRTREIGVRRALGATRWHVVHEVVAESALVALAGGSAGALLVTLLVPAAAGPLGLELSVRLKVVVEALLAASLAGILAGVYPAHKAARIDVIQALRAE